MNDAAQNLHPAPFKWPIDLTVFAILAGMWALCLLVSASVHTGGAAFGDPIQEIFAGIRFEDNQARLVLIAEAGVYAAMAAGILARRNWGLMLALFYMAEVVLSHLAFVIAYLPVRSEWRTVHIVAMQGPTLVLITLYLWIRSNELIFAPSHTDKPARTESPAIRESGPQHQAAVGADSGAGDVRGVI